MLGVSLSVKIDEQIEDVCRIICLEPRAVILYYPTPLSPTVLIAKHFHTAQRQSELKDRCYEKQIMQQPKT